MHIGMILDKSFPPDIRVEKEAKALSHAGYKLSILSRKTPEKPLEKEYSSELDAHIVRKEIKCRKYKIEVINDALRMYYPMWYDPIRNFIKEEKIDILHVHDLWLVPTAIKVANQMGLLVIADLHENMPAAMRAYRSSESSYKRMMHTLLFNYHKMQKQEAAALHNCARVIIVTPEAAERLFQYGISDKEIVVVSNTEDETSFTFELASVDEEIVNRYRNNWIASYIGGLGPHRGLDIALKAVPHIMKEIPTFKLLIVGAREKDRFQIERESLQLDIQNYVEIIGWQPFNKVNSYINASQVCLIPHRDFEHTQTTVPHKLFQYMICRKPVLVSSCRPLKRIVQETDAGRVFDVDDPISLANELVWMYKNPKTCLQYGENGHSAALSRYAWKYDAKRLVEMYREIEGKKPIASGRD